MCWKGLGRLLVETGRVAEGVAELRRSVALAPARASAHEALAFALYRAGAPAEAGDAAARARALAPGNPAMKARLDALARAIAAALPAGAGAGAGAGSAH